MFSQKIFLDKTRASQRYVRVNLLDSRSALRELFLDFIAWLDRNANQEVRRVHTDNAADFLAFKKPMRTIDIELLHRLHTHLIPMECQKE